MTATYAAGQKIRASYFNTPIVSAADASVTDGTTVLTTYVNSLTVTGILGVAFVAPPSGQVTVEWMVTGRNSTATKYTITSCEVRAGGSIGSGTVFAASDDNTATAAMSDSAGQQNQHTGLRPIAGLTYGSTYNACITYKVDTSTGTFNRRSIIVRPA